MYITRMPITEEDKQAILELQHEANEKAAAIEKAHNENASSEEYNRAFDEYNRISRKLFDLREAIRKRYVVELSQDKEKALQNAAAILDAYTRKDYQAEAAQAHKWAEEKLYNYKVLFEQGPSYKDVPEIKKEYEYFKEVKATSYQNFKGAYTRLTFITKDEREALILGGHGTEELDNLIYNRAATFYKPNKNEARSDVKSIAPPLGEDGNNMLHAFAEQSPFFQPLLNDPVINTLPSISTRAKNVSLNTRTDVATATKNGVTIMMDDYSKLSTKLRPSAFKLLDAATCQLTTINHTKGENETVHFSLRDYARQCNIDIDPYPCDTPEEAEKEAARAKGTLKEFRKEVATDLEALFSARLAWKNEDMRTGEEKDFADIRIIAKKGIKSGEVFITFFSDIADYLFTRKYIMQYPVSLRAIPNTNPNCYAIGRKLAQYNSMDANANAGRADRIGVKSLLQAAPEIQSYEEMIASGNRNWKTRIKKPLEDSLNLLVEYGVLTNWEYCGTNGKQLTREEMDTSSFPVFSGFLVHFTMNNAPDQTERRANKAKEKQAAAARQKKKKNVNRKKGGTLDTKGGKS